MILTTFVRPAAVKMELLEQRAPGNTAADCRNATALRLNTGTSLFPNAVRARTVVTKILSLVCRFIFVTIAQIFFPALFRSREGYIKQCYLEERAFR